MRIFDKKAFIKDIDIPEIEIRSAGDWVDELDGMEVQKVIMKDNLGRKIYGINGYFINEAWTKEI